MPKVRIHYNRKDRLNKDGKAPVEVSVFFNRKKRMYYRTGIWLEPKEWDTDKKHVQTRHSLYHQYTAMLTDITRDLERIELDQINKGRTFTPDHVESYFAKKRKIETVTFNQFIHDTLYKDKSISTGSFIGYRNMLTHLNAFMPVIHFDEIDFKLADSFNNYLIGKDLNSNTRYKIHKNIRKYISLACLHEHLDLSALMSYKQLKIQQAASNKPVLNQDELDQIEKVKYEPGSKNHTTQIMFLFSCYTGLRFSDVCKLRRMNFYQESGQWMLHTKMIKVARSAGTITQPIQLLFDGKPYQIIEELIQPVVEDPDHEDPGIFPKIANSEANSCLKVIGSEAGIRHKITFHVSRHTFLTRMAKATGNVFKVMQYGGISKIGTAQVYIHLSELMDHNDMKGMKW